VIGWQTTITVRRSSLYQMKNKDLIELLDNQENLQKIRDELVESFPALDFLSVDEMLWLWQCISGNAKEFSKQHMDDSKDSRNMFISIGFGTLNHFFDHHKDPRYDGM